MAKQPRDHDHCAADVVLACNEINRVAKLNALGVARLIQVDRSGETKPPGSERAPRERRDFLQHALFHRSVPKKIAAREADLDLIHLKFEGTRFLNQREESRRSVVEPELAHFPLFIQFSECARYFLRFRQKVGAMQLIKIDAIRLKSLQRTLTRLNNVVRAEIV